MGNASTGGCFQHDEAAAGIEVRIYYISLSQGQEQEPLVSVLDSRGLFKLSVLRLTCFAFEA